MNDEYKIPRLLIDSQDAAQLRMLVQHLKGTRRRTCLFALNGALVVTTRKWALEAVAASMQARAGGDPRLVFAPSPGKGRRAGRA